MSKGEWWGGINEEWFNCGPFESREQAVDELRGTYGDHGFWVGVQGEYHPFSRDFVEELLELEACDVDDECGPSASDNWPPRIDRKSEEYKEANRKIRAILVELCGDCEVFPIENSEHIEASEAEPPCAR